MIDVVALGTPSHQTLLRLREILFEALIHLSRREHESERVFACVCVCVFTSGSKRESESEREMFLKKKEACALTHTHTPKQWLHALVCAL